MTVTLNLAQTVRVHANPEDIGNHFSNPSTPISWTPTDPTICTIELSGGLNLEGVVHPLKIGSTDVTLIAEDASGVSHSGGFIVGVIPEDFTHFDPVADNAQ